MSSEFLPVAQTVPALPKRRSVGFWLLLIGGILFLLILACAGIGGATVYSFSRWINVASQEVDAIFEDVEQGRFADVYSTKFSAGYRKSANPEQHAQFGDLFQRGLGRLQSKTMQTMNRQTVNGAACIVAVYNGQFERGQGTIKVTLIWEDGDWKFHEFRVQSSVFVAMTKCSSCGATHPPDAKFCPKCGKALSVAK